MVKTTNTDNNKNYATREKVGIVLVIVSAFVLFCLITKNLLLVGVGGFISNLFMGIFGYVSYPLLLSVILCGISMVSHKSVNFKPKTWLAIGLVALSAIEILQTALTSLQIHDLSFGQYVAFCYENATAGGVVFGFLAHLLANSIQDAGVYILFGSLVLISFVIVSDLASTVFSTKSTANKTSRVSDYKGASSDSKGLFIETISISSDKNRSNGENGTFDYEVSQTSGSVYDYSKPEQKVDEITRYKEEQAKIYWDRIRDRQQNPLLYGNQPIIEPVHQEDQQSTTQTFSPYQKPAYTDAYTPVRTSDISHEDVPFDVGDIIDGDSESQKIAEENGISYEESVHLSPIEDEKEEKPVAQFDYSSLPPIIVGDDYEEDETVQENEVEETEVELVEEVNDQNDVEEFELPPIIIGDDDVENEEQEEEIEQVQINEEQEEIVHTVKPLSPTAFNQSDSKIKDSVEENSVEQVQESAVEDGLVEENNEDSIVEIFVKDENENNLTEDEQNSDDKSGEIDESLVVMEEDLDSNGEDLEMIDEDVFSQEDVIEIDDSITEDDFYDAHTEEKLPDSDEMDKLFEQEKSESFSSNSSSFIIEDEVEDLTEKNGQTSEDLQKYYGDLNPDSQKQTKLPKGVIKDQIDMDTYAQVQAQKILEEEPPKPKKQLRPYVFPPESLFVTESTPLELDEEEVSRNSELICACLSNIGIHATLINVTKSPAITRYEFDVPIEKGINVKKIETAVENIQYALSSKGSITVKAPIPGKRAVGIEVPNNDVATVAIKDIILSDEFKNLDSPVTIALGKDLSGKSVVTNLAKLPHLLIAGATGTGKSVCLNTIIVSLICKSGPEDLRLILVDPKRVEFVSYENLPHMLVPKAITDEKQALKTFAWLRAEMNRRYILLSSLKCRNIGEYRKHPDVIEGKSEKMPYIVIIVDEYHDLMLNLKSDRKILEDDLMSLAAKARAAGIHIILATQRPTQDVITSTLKSNLPSKICFKVSDRINSQVVIDRPGAEHLVGMGDMLFIGPSSLDWKNPGPNRIQNAYADKEVDAIVKYIIENNDTDFSEEFEREITQEEEPEIIDSPDLVKSDDTMGGYDKDLDVICKLILNENSYSSNKIIRRFRMGYQRVCKITDQLEELGFIGPLKNNKREVLLTPEKYFEFFGKDFMED